MLTLLIKIPDEFKDHFQRDRFEESLIRLKIDAHLMAGNYEKELCSMLFRAFKNAEIQEGGQNEQLETAE